MNNNNYFIWTEGINCENIMMHALRSFDLKHSGETINAYVSSNFDYNASDDLKNNKFIFHKVSKDLEHKFNYGHLGTATLWSKIIKNKSYKSFIHFDSDVIFLDNIISEIKYKLTLYDIVGPIRSYKNNPQNDDYFKQFSDTCSTCIFGFNKNKISNKYLSKEKFYENLKSKFINIINNLRSFKTINSLKSIKDFFSKDNDILIRMILSYNPLGHKVLDAFDPVTFDILNNGGSIGHLDFNDVGGSNQFGSRKNLFKLNDMPEKFKIEYGRKFIHFSSVGSGLYYSEHKNSINVPDSYVDYAIDRYNFYKFLVESDDSVILNPKYTYFNSYKKFRRYFKY